MKQSSPAQQSNVGQHASRNDFTRSTSCSGDSVKGGKYVGRLMIGSLGGLLVMNSMTRQEKGQQERGLFALPFSEFASTRAMARLSIPLVAPGSSPHLHLRSPLFAAFLVFFLLGLLLFIYLFNSEPSSKKTRELKKAPSLASPLEIRQRAWLTSIQTV